uniref:Uncharacterized protein n=1 Tax=Anguilla anguilla TaxID=7936 RepID=A0A0E9XSX3_ANGAN
MKFNWSTELILKKKKTEELYAAYACIKSICFVRFQRLPYFLEL